VQAIKVKMAPTIVKRCEKCSCPVVKKTSTGRFLINGSNVALDTSTMTASGKCPRCNEDYSVVLS
jgi:hypothetical protein